MNDVKCIRCRIYDLQEKFDLVTYLVTYLVSYRQSDSWRSSAPKMNKDFHIAQ